VGWFTAHIREGVAVTGHQLELPQPPWPGRGGLMMPLRRGSSGSIKSKPATWSISRTGRISRKALPNLELGLEALLRGWQ